MEPRARPYSTSRVIVVGLAIAVGFSLLSLFFLFLQARSSQARLAGMVVAVAEDSLTIRNRRGVETVLMTARIEEQRDLDYLERAALGDHLMVRGDMIADGVLDMVDLRPIDAPRER